MSTGIKNMLEETRFINYLLLNTSFNNNLGLFDGKAAAALYGYQLNASHTNQWSGDIAFSLLEETLSQINLYTRLTFGNGIAGIGTLLEYLTQNGYLEENTNDLLKETENYLLSAVYGSKIQETGIARGTSGLGLYFLHRLRATTPALPFEQLRFKEAVIACTDQVHNLFVAQNSTVGKNAINAGIFEGYGGTLLFLNQVNRLQWYEPFTTKLIRQIVEVIYEQLQQVAFHWQQAQALFALLHCDLPGQDSNFNKVITGSLHKWLQEAEDFCDSVDFYESAFNALWLKLIHWQTQNADALSLSNKIKEHTQKVLEQNTLSALFPFNKPEHNVPVGLNRGVCATALPLLSLEINDFSWLGIFGIEVQTPSAIEKGKKQLAKSNL